jgi:hypothetical protein
MDTQVEGGLRFCVSVKAADMRDWPADRIKQFFDGVAQVCRAADFQAEVELPDPRIPPVARPRFTHKCHSCTFLGHVDGCDLYGHPKGDGLVALTARHSDKSATEMTVVEDTVLRQDRFCFAQERAKEAGLFRLLPSLITHNSEP